MNEGDKKSPPDDALHRDEEMPMTIEKEAAATVEENLFKKVNHFYGFLELVELIHCIEAFRWW